MGVRMAAWVAVLAAVPAVACGDHAARAASPASTVTTQAVAATVGADPRIGALFVNSADIHSCTAAIVHSQTGDLVLTAAHCLAGGVTDEFVPDLGAATTPDTWQVDAVYLDPRWLASTDPRADYAILRVHHDGKGAIEQAVAPGLTLGMAPDIGSVVSVTGYPLGVGGGPLRCQSAVMVAATGFPAVSCAGLGDGTSGAPWVDGSVVSGVTGGYDGGGCGPDVSYASPFDAAIVRLLARADAGGPGDVPPASYTATC
ncbi:MAG TPA: serine protease [Mycobacterium sp.]|nr:serine protease [Mycobacterium sp.]